ncbi:MAG: ATP-binding protein [Bacillota bacterium]
MKSLLTDILELIKEISGSSAAALIRNSKDKNAYLSAYAGTIPPECLEEFFKGIFLQSALHGISANADLTQLSAVLEKFSVKSVYISRIDLDGSPGPNPLLILLSETESCYDELNRSRIKIHEKLLKKWILRETFISDKLLEPDLEKMRDDLAHSEEKFQLLIETANDLIFNLDYYGYFLTVNNYGALALGYKPGEMTGRHFLEFVDDENKTEIAMAFQQILMSDKVISFEVAFRDKFGKKIVFEIQGRPTKVKDAISGLLGIGRDITQRRIDEEKLRELNSKLIEANRLVSIERDRARQQVSVLEELNRLKNEFISNISHELRTPLASIVGFSETIISDPEMPKEMVLEFSSIIMNEGKRLAKLINDVLDFAKMEAGEVAVFKAEFDVVQLLNEIIQSFGETASEKGITITADIPVVNISLNADRERIGQVYQHLISNAIKFTNPGGRITIIAENFTKEFEVIVSDTGMGIPEKDLPNIFQKFYKASRPGTQIPGIGIGLGLVKQIVDLHKGLITVQSELNKGTTFIVKLPKFN